MRAEEILALGAYNTFKVRYQLGTVAYREYIQALNPFVLAYMELYEKWERLENVNNSLCDTATHYKERFLCLASLMQRYQKELADAGITSASLCIGK